MKRNNAAIERLIRLAYKQWKKSLPKSNDPCPDEEALTCFIEGLLNAKDATNLKKHLIRCDKCMESVVSTAKIK